MRVTRRNGFACVALMLQCIILLVLSNMITVKSLQETMRAVGWVSILGAVANLSIIFFCKREVNVYFIFVALSYLFSFGQCILTAIGVKPYRGVFGIANGFFSSKELWTASMFVMVAISVTSLGFCLCKQEKPVRVKEKFKLPGTDRLLRIAWILLIITIVPTLYALYQDIVTMSTVGYTMTLINQVGMMKLFMLLSGFFQSSILILYCFEEKHRKILFLVVSIYFVLQLIGGSRISVFRYAILMLLISNFFRKEMTKAKWMFIGFCGLGMVFIFALVSSVRTTVFLSTDISTMLNEAVGNLIDDNFIFSAIREMGNTQCINTLVYNSCPKDVGYCLGGTMLRSIYGIIPNIFGVGYDSVDTVFSPLYTVTNAGMGSSYIAEGYWNFGYFSLIYFAGFGFAWGKLEERFKMQCNRPAKSASVFFITIYLMFFLIFTVRSDLMEFGRSFVYYALIPVLLSKVRTVASTKSN